jgi:hypothetical protein
MTDSAQYTAEELREIAELVGQYPDRTWYTLRSGRGLAGATAQNLAKDAEKFRPEDEK